MATTRPQADGNDEADRPMEEIKCSYVEISWDWS